MVDQKIESFKEIPQIELTPEQLGLLFANPLEVFRSLQEQYNSRVFLIKNYPGMPMYIDLDPMDGRFIHDVELMDKPEYVATLINPPYGFAPTITEEGIVWNENNLVSVLTNDQWKTYHDLAIPNFKREKIVSEYLPKYPGIINQWLEQINNSSFKYDDVRRLTFSLMYSGFIGKEAPQEAVDAIPFNVTKAFMEMFAALARHEMPNIAEIAKPYLDYMDKVLAEEYPEEYNNLITNFQRAEGLTHTEKRGLILNIMHAGDDTTANAVTAALFELASNPEIQEKLREEINNPNWTPQWVYNPETYTYKFITEVLRMYPPTDIVRFTKQDVQTSEGQIIPQGQTVRFIVEAVNKDPRFWSDPDTFNPERYANEISAEDPRNEAYDPFGKGIRQCIGRNLSLLEQAIILAIALRRNVVKTNDSTYPAKMSFVKGLPEPIVDLAFEDVETKPVEA